MENETAKDTDDPKTQGLTQSDVDEILRRKRKARGQRACYPCRQRKVRCSYGSPCRICVDRAHPELCLYEFPSKFSTASIPSSSSAVPAVTPTISSSISTGPSSSQSSSSLKPQMEDTTKYATTVEQTQSEGEDLRARLDRLEELLQELRKDMRQIINSKLPTSIDGEEHNPKQALSDANALTTKINAQDIHRRNEVTGEAVYLGGHSVPAMAVALGGGSDEETISELLSNSVLPLFGLDNESATYPFVDLWGLPHGSESRIRGICGLIPSDADCLSYFRQYRDTPFVLFPGVVDIAQFESDLMSFLNTRASAMATGQGSLLTEQEVFGKSLHWVGLMFAILASGCQCSEAPRKERQLTSQVYVCCAYECLRTINYLSHSTAIDVQNLLVLGNVISNNMNAGTAWCLLGLTIRLAQSQGLHRPCPASMPFKEKYLREEVWWRIVWQDSLLSISYDRATSIPIIKHHQNAQEIQSSGASYIECMKRLCELGLEIVQDRSRMKEVQNQVSAITQRHEAISKMMEDALPHLQNPAACKSMTERLEHWNLYLHRSYIISEMCRPVLKASSDRKSETISDLRRRCIESLADTVDAFLGLQNITRFASQSWAAVHRALSSALLLGILKEPNKSQRVEMLLNRLISVMLDTSSKLEQNEISGPITRSISALCRLTARSGQDGQKRPSLPPGLGSVGSSEFSWDPQSVWASSLIDSTSTIPMSTPSTHSDDGSPYALMDSILWGNQNINLSTS